MADRIVVVGDQPGEPVHEHERGHSLGPRRREFDRGDAAARLRDDHGPIDVAGVEHGFEVGRGALDGRRVRRVDRIRHPDSAHVEADQPPDRRQPPEVVRAVRLLVEGVDGDREGRHVQQIERAGAHDRVRKVRAAALRVPVAASTTSFSQPRPGRARRRRRPGARRPGPGQAS